MNIDNEVVQIYIPSTDIAKSVEWYINVFGYQVIWQERDSANLRLKNGPLLFLKKTEYPQPIKFTMGDDESPVISFKTSDIHAIHTMLKNNGYDVCEIEEYGEGTNGAYMDFYVRDPDGNLLEINSYPDISLEKFRGY